MFWIVIHSVKIVNVVKLVKDSENYVICVFSTITHIISFFFDFSPKFALSYISLPSYFQIIIRIRMTH